MRILACILSIVFSSYGQAQTNVIKAKSYIDVRSGKLISPATILIEKGIIKAINPVSVPDSATVINLPDKILLPGLIDAHVHIDMNLGQGYAFQPITENPAKAALRASANAKATLMGGVTTIRNMGQIHHTPMLIDVALSEAAENDWIESPRIVPSGHFLSITGGHGDPVMQGNFAEGVIETGPENGVADGIDEVVKATRYQIRYGAKVIKLMATAGVFSLEGTVGAQQYSFGEMKAIVDEASRHHVKVAAHAHGTEGIISAINAGVASIEHGSLQTDSSIALMKAKNVFLVPTTGLLDVIAGSFDKLDPIIVEKAKFITAKAKESHTKAIKAGVRFAMGTDAPLLPHGKNAYELTALVNRGMKPIEAIQAATVNAAELLGVNDRGEMKEGLIADIIAVDSNPLENISVMEKVVFVMKGGKVFKNLSR
ncbi:amidohydrolase family protein [Pollutibacter soli]|uniref:metal-dependent hydrolase family protein n=1 Tax=Pollutibacter soli TaxID=3034157 RepID=UPI0030132CEB